MKKFIAVLTATALLAVPLCVSAAPSPSAKDVSGNSSSAVVATSSSAATSTSSESAATTIEAAAAAAGMSVVEYTNNAIVSTPGLPDAAVVAQGGKIKVNGVATNMTITLRKVSTSVLNSAKAAATGKILSVFEAKLPVAKGHTVEANFYVKGITADSNISVFQLIDGVWTPLTVVEVRADHVVFDLSQSGPIMIVLN